MSAISCFTFVLVSFGSFIQELLSQTDKHVFFFLTESLVCVYQYSCLHPFRVTIQLRNLQLCWGWALTMWSRWNAMKGGRVSFSPSKQIWVNRNCKARQWCICSGVCVCVCLVPHFRTDADFYFYCSVFFKMTSGQMQSNNNYSSHTSVYVSCFQRENDFCWTGGSHCFSQKEGKCLSQRRSLRVSKENEYQAF